MGSTPRIAPPNWRDEIPDPASKVPSLPVQVATFVAQLIGIPLLAIVVQIAIRRDQGFGVATWILIGGSVFVVFALLVGLPTLFRARRLNALRRMRQSGLTFSFTGGSMTAADVATLDDNGLMQQLDGLPERADFLRSAFEAVADANGISLWRGTPTEPFASIPWSLVQRVHNSADSRDRAVILAIGDGNRQDDLRLPSATIRVVAAAYQNDCWKVASQLEHLRLRAVQKA